MHIEDQFQYDGEPDFQNLSPPVNIEHNTTILYEGGIWPTSRQYSLSNGLSPLPSQQSVIDWMSSRFGSWTGFLAIDFENYKWTAQTDSLLNAQIDQFLTMIGWIRIGAPLAKIGYYGIMPEHNPSRAVKRPYDTTWQDRNEKLLPLMDEMDAFFPSVYQNTTDANYWDLTVEGYIEELKRLQNPDKNVLGYLQPNYNPSKSAVEPDSLAGQPYTQAEMLSRLTSMEAKGYHSCILWKPDAGQWDNNAPWYKGVKDFLNTQSPPAPVPAISVSPTSALTGANVAVSWSNFPVQAGTYIEAFNVTTGLSAGVRWCADCSSGGVPIGNGPASGSCNFTFATAGTYRFVAFDGTVAPSTLLVTAPSGNAALILSANSVEAGTDVTVSWVNFPATPDIYTAMYRLDPLPVEQIGEVKFADGCGNVAPHTPTPASGNCIFSTTGLPVGTYRFDSAVLVVGAPDTLVAQSAQLAITAPAQTNVVPIASNVRINGLPIVGEILSVLFDYTDADNDAQGVHLYEWSRDDATIIGSNASYIPTVDDVGFVLRCKVKPGALTGASPGLSQSASIGPIELPVNISDLLLCYTLPYTGYIVAEDTMATVGKFLKPVAQEKSIDLRTSVLVDGIYRLTFRVRNIGPNKEAINILSEFGDIYSLPVPVNDGWQEVRDFKGTVLFNDVTMPLIRVYGGESLQFDWIKLELKQALITS